MLQVMRIEAKPQHEVGHISLELNSAVMYNGGGSID